MPTDSMSHPVVQSLKWFACLGLMLIAGCFNPATWPAEKVAEDVKQQWAQFEVTEVKLTSTSSGYEGTAKCSNGETFKITLTKDVNKKTVIGSGVGDRGTTLDYSIKAVPK